MKLLFARFANVLAKNHAILSRMIFALTSLPSNSVIRDFLNQKSYGQLAIVILQWKLNPIHLELSQQKNGGKLSKFLQTFRVCLPVFTSFCWCWKNTSRWDAGGYLHRKLNVSTEIRTLQILLFTTGKARKLIRLFREHAFLHPFCNHWCSLQSEWLPAKLFIYEPHNFSLYIASFFICCINKY